MTTETAVERRVRIVRDEDPMDPREWSNVGTMVCWHGRYNLGDTQPSLDPAEWRRALAGEIVSARDPDLIPEEHVERILDKHTVMLPLYLYDHSGITMRTAPFSCPWDSGQVGYIYVTAERAREELGEPWRENATACLEVEVKTYDQYLTGDVWGFVCEELRDTSPCTCPQCACRSWVAVDPFCFGFFGDLESNGMLDEVGEEWGDLMREAWEERG